MSTHAAAGPTISEAEDLDRCAPGTAVVDWLGVVWQGASKSDGLLWQSGGGWSMTSRDLIEHSDSVTVVYEPENTVTEEPAVRLPQDVASVVARRVRELRSEYVERGRDSAILITRVDLDTIVSEFSDKALIGTISPRDRARQTVDRIRERSWWTSGDSAERGSDELMVRVDTLKIVAESADGASGTTPVAALVDRALVQPADGAERTRPEPATVEQLDQLRERVETVEQRLADILAANESGPAGRQPTA